MSKPLLCPQAIEQLRQQKQQNEKMRNDISRKLDAHSPGIIHDLDARSRLKRAIEKGFQKTYMFLKAVEDLNAINTKIKAFPSEFQRDIETRHCLNEEIKFIQNVLIDYACFRQCPYMSGSQLQPCEKMPFQGYCKGCEHLHGYLVKLIRDKNNQWSMRTRKDTFLYPPPAFLQGLEQNKELPVVHGWRTRNQLYWL
jgi:hypothetical protein